MASSSASLLALARELAWRQWTALGVAGVKRTDGHAIIDLEALILHTAGLGDTDPRLRDEATDWCVQFGPRFVAASRLRNLLSIEPPETRAPLLEFLATVNAHAATRWPLSAAARPRRVELSGKSRLPDLRKRPELLRLQLRALFGNSARAEILTTFIASRPTPEPTLSASDLVTTGYSKRNVSLVLTDLASAGLLSERRIGNTLRYRLERRPALNALAPGASTAVATRWDLRFRALASARRLFAATDSKAPAIASVETRRWVEDLAPTWDALDLSSPTPADPLRYQTEVGVWLEQELIPSALR